MASTLHLAKFMPTSAAFDTLASLSFSFSFFFFFFSFLFLSFILSFFLDSWDQAQGLFTDLHIASSLFISFFILIL